MFGNLAGAKAAGGDIVNTVSKIRDRLSLFNKAIQRAEANGDAINEPFVRKIQQDFAALDAQAHDDANRNLLENIQEEAEMLAQLRAYIFPEDEIAQEGLNCIQEMEEWDVPREVIEKIKAGPAKRLVSEDKSVARSALLTIFEQFDSWYDYTDGFESAMESYTVWLLILTVASLLLAVAALQFRQTFLLSVVLAGASGSCVSVMAKMPSAKNVSLTGEWAAYLRHILARVGTGIAASWIGFAFLSWGLLPVSVGSHSFSDIVSACTQSSATSCSISDELVLLAVAMLLGFSERALLTFESHLLGSHKSTHRR